MLSPAGRCRPCVRLSELRLDRRRPRRSVALGEESRSYCSLRRLELACQARGLPAKIPHRWHRPTGSDPSARESRLPPPEQIAQIQG